MSNMIINKILPITDTYPVLFRRYNLIDFNDGFFNLSIAPNFIKSQDNSDIDQVYAEWTLHHNNKYELKLSIHVLGNNYECCKLKNSHLLAKLPIYISRIINGDKVFFNNYPNLNDSYVIVRFLSDFEEFNKTFYYCKVMHYLKK